MFGFLAFLSCMITNFSRRRYGLFDLLVTKPIFKNECLGSINQYFPPTHGIHLFVRREVSQSSVFVQISSGLSMNVTQQSWLPHMPLNRCPWTY